MAQRAPESLSEPGRALWAAVVERNEPAPVEAILLEQACRSFDVQVRLVAVLMDPEVPKALPQRLIREIAATARTTRELITALRLPDERGRRPQRRSTRGVYLRRAAQPQILEPSAPRRAPQNAQGVEPPDGAPPSGGAA